MNQVDGSMHASSNDFQMASSPMQQGEQPLQHGNVDENDDSDDLFGGNFDNDHADDTWEAPSASPPRMSVTCVIQVLRRGEWMTSDDTMPTTANENQLLTAHVQEIQQRIQELTFETGEDVEDGEDDEYIIFNQPLDETLPIGPNDTQMHVAHPSVPRLTMEDDGDIFNRPLDDTLPTAANVTQMLTAYDNENFTTMGLCSEHEESNGRPRILVVINLQSLATCDTVYNMFKQFGTIEVVKVIFIMGKINFIIKDNIIIFMIR